MIRIEWGIHLTSRTNGSHGHWSSVARAAASQRHQITLMIDGQLRRLTQGEEPYCLKRVKYWGKFNGLKVEKTKMVRILSPSWAARLDAGISVTFTRFAEKPLDGDNLQTAFKSIRDGVADAFGIRDDDPRMTFEYSQRAEPPSRILVTIDWKAAAA